jgi:DNA sulfur modification protein DndB
LIFQELIQILNSLSSNESEKKSNYSSLSNLKKINWARSNARDWEGRVMMGGRLTKASNSVVLATAFIKKFIGLELSPEEIKADAAFNKSRSRK